MINFFCLNATKQAAFFFSLAIAATISGPLQAQETPDTTGWFKKTFSQTKSRLDNIVENGDKEVYLSGYSYHGRHTYTEERIRELNKEAWGLGGGLTLCNESGNAESLYLFAIRDSHFKPQIMAGYAYEWVWNISKTPVEVSAGYTTMLISRQDYFSSVPFPIAIPVAGIGVKGAKFMASYIPRLSSNKGNGDVLLMFFRMNVK